MERIAKKDAKHHIMTFTFKEEATSYQVFSELKKYHARGQVDFEQIAVIKRNENGAFSFEDAVDLSGSNRAVKGSLIGMAVGILGGSFGILLGSMTGMLIGGSKDMKENQEIQETFKRTLGVIPPGQTGIIAIGEEFEPSVLDGLVAQHDGTLERTDEQLES
ncbi:hypothetical protein [Exiguobacterium sp. UBA5002]|uniref:hypothetical protein n=2 Tax=unclassified Exiguobacterium TaxID=2644629 RepID=UPI0025BC4DC5|nr:hypothetical protein [Exiguobacterium sp. UBA5002]